MSAAPKRSSAQAEQAETPPQTSPGVQSPPLDELREDYLRERRVEGIRETALCMYNEALRLFENWAHGEGVLFAHQIKTKHIQDFLLSQMARKLSERMVRNRAIVLKGMLKFASVSSVSMMDMATP